MSNDTPQEDELLLNLLEPHYSNMGFEWGEDAKKAALKSQTYKNLQALIKTREHEAELRGRIDELEDVHNGFRWHSIETYGGFIKWKANRLKHLTAPTTDVTATEGGA